MNYTGVSTLADLHNTKKEIESQLNFVRLKARLPEQILEDVCREMGMPKKILLSRSRSEWIVEVRKSMVWLMRICGASYPQISIILDMNHASLIYLFREFPSSFLRMSEINQEAMVKLITRYGKEDEDNN